ncbi:MAG TPA: STAS domain-containing protein [Bryobacteraceae bacterium]|jgi:anti-anti-sigma factor|nr:STAS domain-containing protein [Bryobacteraceae bacterium]
MTQTWSSDAIAGRTLHVEVAGDVLSTTSDGIRGRITRELARAGSSIAAFELNMAHARMIDSAGLNLLVWLIKQVGIRGGKVRLRLSDPEVLRAVRFTRLGRDAEILQMA